MVTAVTALPGSLRCEDSEHGASTGDGNRRCQGLMGELDFHIHLFHSSSAPTELILRTRCRPGLRGLSGNNPDGLPALGGCTFLPQDSVNVQAQPRSFRIMTSVLEEPSRTEWGQAVGQANFN